MTERVGGRLVDLLAPAPGELEPFFRLRPAEPRTLHLGWGDESSPDRPPAPEEPLGPLLVRDARTGETYGFATGYRPARSAAVDVSVFLDPGRSPPGVGVEAYVLYARRLAEYGVPAIRILQLGGDDVGRRMLERLGMRPAVRMREHVWSGGALHDWLVYRLEVGAFDAVQERLETLLHRRAPAGR